MKLYENLKEWDIKVGGIKFCKCKNIDGNTKKSQFSPSQRFELGTTMLVTRYSSKLRK